MLGNGAIYPALHGYTEICGSHAEGQYNRLSLKSH